MSQIFEEPVPSPPSDELATEQAPYMAAKQTGIFCRSSCKARKPKSGRRDYFITADSALQAGFRPCLHCRPLAGDSASHMVAELQKLVKADPTRHWTERAIAELGYDPRRV